MRSPEKEQELTGLSGVLVTKLDVTDETSITAAVKAALDAFGQIDVLVNNAGYGALGALEAASDEEVRRQLEVNFFGLIAVTKAVLPSMRAHRTGAIVNISSVGGRITFPFSTLYHATKFAVEGLTESLQYELNPLGIRTKIVEPGGYRTEFAGRSLAPFGAGNLADYQQPWALFTTKLAEWTFSENIREVADVIYQAATDGSEQLRYPVGQDAVQLLQVRQQVDDATFKKVIVEQTGIA
ncbi:SDR family oxidoreductase [Dinghuibacter silviterrae]|uniref:Short subunit dehydrogenase n=1 Tax=Dinghuibacter silviterrae TaxID=1539049 RepID=A0A4R8DM69_9BACT|nr:SDR family oxidoreductase [Dinghuibacter silviterrae]TDW99069.1 short subunit dehydrogenase [Dinghuibacter silviterrae]